MNNQNDTNPVRPLDSGVHLRSMVWEAWRRVKANKGAPGVDGQALEQFEADLRNNLYKIWNRISSGSYLPPPVRAVEIPKPQGDGVRVLGVPTIADRVAQTVVAMHLRARGGCATAGGSAAPPTRISRRVCPPGR
jgi:retron-type reverse transcriptase